MEERKIGDVPLVTLTQKSADYVDEYQRGTVAFNRGWGNYSFHTVEITAPITIVECNFAQAKPETPAIKISGEGEVKFIDCNLTNVLLDPKWILEGCCTVQSWIVREDDGLGNLSDTRQVICTHPDHLTEETKIPPRDAILSKV